MKVGEIKVVIKELLLFGFLAPDIREFAAGIEVVFEKSENQI